MKFNSGNRAQDVDDIYTRICQVLDSVPAQSRELYLARLCLLLVGEIDEKESVMKLVDQAHIAA